MAVSKSTRLRRVRQAPRGGYQFLATVLDQIDCGPLLEALGGPAHIGRPAYPASAMLRAFLSKFILNFRYNLVLLERLRASPKFRQVCGFPGQVPSESTLSRFTSRLTLHQDLIDCCLEEIADDLHGLLPGLGETVAVDSTSVESFSNPNRKTVSDPEARWGFRHKANAKDGAMEWVFGYKLHMLADADYGVPLSYVVRTANDSDSPELPGLLKDAMATHSWLKPSIVLGDRGYDAESNHRAVVDAGASPVIHMRTSTAADGLHEGIYTDRGEPTCMGGKAMRFVGTCPDTGRHRFQCQTEGCHLKGKTKGGIRYCDSTVEENPMEHLRTLGIIARASEEWSTHYSKRMDIERVFRSLKHSRGLEGHRWRGMVKVRLLAVLSMLTFCMTVLARIRVNDVGNWRIMRVKVA